MADLEQFYNKLFQFLYKNRKKGHDIIGLLQDLEHLQLVKSCLIYSGNQGIMFP